MNNRKVVITGLGVIAPNGIGKNAFWQSILSGSLGLQFNSAAMQYKFRSRVFGKVNEFNSNVSRAGGRYQAFAVEAVRMAIHDSNIDLTKIDHSRFGVCIASAIAGAAKMEANFLLETDPDIKRIGIYVGNCLGGWSHIEEENSFSSQNGDTRCRSICYNSLVSSCLARSNFTSLRIFG